MALLPLANEKEEKEEVLVERRVSSTTNSLIINEEEQEREAWLWRSSRRGIVCRRDSLEIKIITNSRKLGLGVWSLW